MGIDELIAALLRLPPDDLARVHEALRAVRDGAAAPYNAEPSGESMTLVTMPLPDDLAEEARNAGLLAGKSLEEMLRRALAEHEATIDIAPGQERRLVRGENGYLVVEAFPGEKPITTEEVKRILNGMGW